MKKSKCVSKCCGAEVKHRYKNRTDNIGETYCNACLSPCDTIEEVQNEEKGEEYNFPDWITDEMKRNFYGMYECFGRTSKDYYEQKNTELNGKTVLAIPLLEDKEYSGIYFHKWNNIGWLLLPSGEVKTVASPTPTQPEKEWKEIKQDIIDTLPLIADFEVVDCEENIEDIKSKLDKLISYLLSQKDKEVEEIIENEKRYGVNAHGTESKEWFEKQEHDNRVYNSALDKIKALLKPNK